MAQVAPAVVTSDVEANVNTFLTKVYLLMFVGLSVTGVVSYWISANTEFQSLLVASPWIGWGLFVLQVFLVAVISARVMEMAPAVAAALFLVYAALVGVSFSAIFLLYSQDQIYTVFIMTSVTFLVTGLIGMAIKKDMTGAGHFLFMLLTGWILVWLASWLFSWLFGQPMSNLNWALNFVGIAIFVGLTAWDTQQLKKIGQQGGGGGRVIIGALKLYLDYINLFLLMLRASSR